MRRNYERKKREGKRASKRTRKRTDSCCWCCDDILDSMDRHTEKRVLQADESVFLVSSHCD